MKDNARVRLRIAFQAFLVLLFFCGSLWADDCNVRGNDGSGAVVKLNCEPPGTLSPLMVHTPTGLRGLKLVAVEDPPGTPNPLASNFRVRYTDNSSGTPKEVIKAIGKILPGISSCEELQMIGYHPSYPYIKNYELAEEINCSATNPADPDHATSLWGLGYAAFYPNGFDGIPASGDENIEALSLPLLGAKGFRTLGATSLLSFSMTFNGNNKVIRNLTILRPLDTQVGLFRSAMGATIENVRLFGGAINGGSEVGSLVSVLANNSSMTNVYSTCAVSGAQTVGGLAGRIDTSSISDSYAAGPVTGGKFVGGLAGYMNDSMIVRSYASGDITALGGGSDYVYTGGLVGASWRSTDRIIDSYALGTVNGNGRYVGGLVGANSGSVTNSYASGTGRVMGTATVGGLVGAHISGMITNSYATKGVVGSGSFIGGLVGHSNHCNNIINSAWRIQLGMKAVGYAVPNYTSGLNLLADASWGTDSATIDAFYLTSHPVYQNSWDFSDIWEAVPGGLPRLKWQDN